MIPSTYGASLWTLFEEQKDQNPFNQRFGKVPFLRDTEYLFDLSDQTKVLLIPGPWTFQIWSKVEIKALNPIEQFKYYFAEEAYYCNEKRKINLLKRKTKDNYFTAVKWLIQDLPLILKKTHNSTQGHDFKDSVKYKRAYLFLYNEMERILTLE